MKKIYYYAMVAGLLCGTGCSEEPSDTVGKDGSIYGVITDNTGNPLVAASVALSTVDEKAMKYDLNEDYIYQRYTARVTQTVTGSDGHYEFKNVTTRENYAIKVSSNGYQPQAQRLIVEAGKTVGGDVRLTKLNICLSVVTEPILGITKSSAKVEVNFLRSFRYYNPTNGEGSFDTEHSFNDDGRQYTEHISTLPNSVGFYYATNVDPQKGTKVNVSGNFEDGYYNWNKTYTRIHNLTGLTANTTYYVQGFATNAVGTEYGNIVSFTAEEKDYSGEYEVIDNLMVSRSDAGVASYITVYTKCSESRVAGFSDWRLPTSSELGVMYTNREKIGGFSNNDPYCYWSSSSCNTGMGYTSWFQMRFDNGTSVCDDDNARVRCVRTK